MLNDPDDSAMSTLNLALETAVYTQRIIAKHPALFIFWEIITFRSVRHDFSDLKKKFAFVEALVLTTFFPDARQIVQRVEKHVLGTKADEALVLRKSISEDCTMLAVAAAIVAQVAITALGLEKLDEVHWTAKAAFTISLTLGSLSVFYSCLVQQRMTSLFTTEEVKDFFSKPSSSKELRHFERKLDKLVNELRKTASSNETPNESHEKLKNVETAVNKFKNQNRWKAASFHSIVMIKAPTILLKYALGAFVIGLGIYFGGLAFNYQDPARDSSLSIFIFYLVSSFLGLWTYYVPALLRDLEMSSLRRYARLINDSAWSSIQYNQSDEEMIENIIKTLKREYAESYRETSSEESLTREETPEDKFHPQTSHSTSSQRPISRENRNPLRWETLNPEYQ